MKEIHWRSTGLIVEMSYIKRCSAQAIQVLIGCAWSPLGVRSKASRRYSFLGCTVAPGFEFQDFEMLSEGQQRWRT